MEQAGKPRYPTDLEEDMVEDLDPDEELEGMEEDDGSDLSMDDDEPNKDDKKYSMKDMLTQPQLFQQMMSMQMMGQKNGGMMMNFGQKGGGMLMQQGAMGQMDMCGMLPSMMQQQQHGMFQYPMGYPQQHAMSSSMSHIGSSSGHAHDMAGGPSMQPGASHMAGKGYNMEVGGYPGSLTGGKGVPHYPPGNLS
eukprot:921280-Karenia_brevis.AAC.1